PKQNFISFGIDELSNRIIEIVKKLAGHEIEKQEAPCLTELDQQKHNTTEVKRQRWQERINKFGSVIKNRINCLCRGVIRGMLVGGGCGVISGGIICAIWRIAPEGGVVVTISSIIAGMIVFGGAGMTIGAFLWGIAGIIFGIKDQRIDENRK
ncbi:MAG: hypothetical protein LBH59_07835, partial [Planctomycetaceae bacterium]|nr:hypothetical protein [Planctomycetaceae bacterium]